MMYQIALLCVETGLETTAHALETATIHLNVPENSAMLKRWKDELAEIWPDANNEIPSWKTLEKVPYLQAVIKESLRLSMGVSIRLSRINRHEDMVYNKWTIPKGLQNQHVTIQSPFR